MSTYVGELREVSFCDDAGEVYTVKCARVALSVSERGLCTSPTKQTAAAGQEYEAPRGATWFDLTELVYYRRRQAGALWFHEIEGGRVAIIDEGPGRLPMAVLNVPAARRCDLSGDFICGG